MGAACLVVGGPWCRSCVSAGMLAKTEPELDTGRDDGRQAASPSVTDHAPIVLLTSDGALARIVAAHLSRAFAGLHVVVEQSEGKRAIFRRRARLVGVVSSFGQAALSVALRLKRRSASSRQAEIERACRFDDQFAPGTVIHAVGSVNDAECRRLIARLGPKVIAVYGTRIIGAATLDAADAPFINYHAGINPKYRGQHPAYWARVAGDDDNAGVTIHIVDRGVDTGGVIAQARVAFDRRDTIQTYQWVQAGVALPLFVRVLRDALDGFVEPADVALPSNKYFPPTLWAYLWHGVARGVW
jgi:folate-dependent phosphoribosylglycinamide formyltransferase PurN